MRDAILYFLRIKRPTTKSVDGLFLTKELAQGVKTRLAPKNVPLIREGQVPQVIQENDFALKMAPFERILRTHRRIPLS
jgi:hypothetical protein